METWTFSLNIRLFILLRMKEIDIIMMLFMHLNNNNTVNILQNDK